MKKLKTVCAWCDILIQDGYTHLLFGEERVSHGICKKCIKKLREKDKKENINETN